MLGTHNGCAQSIMTGYLPIEILNDPLILWVVVAMLPGVTMQPETKGRLPSELVNQTAGPHAGRLSTTDGEEICSLDIQPEF